MKPLRVSGLATFIIAGMRLRRIPVFVLQGQSRRARLDPTHSQDRLERVPGPTASAKVLAQQDPEVSPPGRTAGLLLQADELAEPLQLRSHVAITAATSAAAAAASRGLSPAAAIHSTSSSTSPSSSADFRFLRERIRPLVASGLRQATFAADLQQPSGVSRSEELQSLQQGTLDAGDRRCGSPSSFGRCVLHSTVVAVVTPIVTFERRLLTTH